jgi:hypothetical protein
MQELEREKERARAEQMLQRQRSPASLSPMQVKVKARYTAAASSQQNNVHDQRNSAPTADCETRRTEKSTLIADRDDLRALNETEILVISDPKLNSVCSLCGMREHSAHSCPEQLVKNNKTHSVTSMPVAHEANYV